jgi:hypothetical protein
MMMDITKEREEKEEKLVTSFEAMEIGDGPGDYKMPMSIFRGDPNYGPMTQDDLEQDFTGCLDFSMTDGVPDAERGTQVGGGDDNDNGDLINRAIDGHTRVTDARSRPPQRAAAVAASNLIAAGTYSITAIEVKGFGMRAGGAVDGVDLNGGYTMSNRSCCTPAHALS